MFSMTKLDYVYKNELLKDFRFTLLPCKHEFLQKAHLAFLTNTLHLKHPQNFYQNQKFTEGFSLQYLSNFCEGWCNFHKIGFSTKRSIKMVWVNFLGLNKLHAWCVCATWAQRDLRACKSIKTPLSSTPMLFKVVSYFCV